MSEIPKVLTRTATLCDLKNKDKCFITQLIERTQ